jgi:hypothetical protein
VFVDGIPQDANQAKGWTLKVRVLEAKTTSGESLSSVNVDFDGNALDEDRYVSGDGKCTTGNYLVRSLLTNT